MATSVRQSYRNPASISSGKQPGVRSYPLPVTGGSRSTTTDRSLHPTVAPGPVPGHAIPSSSSSGRRQAQPPPAQSRGQYAEHFPSLPGTDHPPIIMTRDSEKVTTRDLPSPPAAREPTPIDRGSTEGQQRQRPPTRRRGRRGENDERRTPPPHSQGQRYYAPPEKSERPLYSIDPSSPPHVMAHPVTSWTHPSHYIYPLHRHYGQAADRLAQHYPVSDHPYPEHDLYYAQHFHLEPPAHPPRLPAHPPPSSQHEPSQDLHADRVSQEAEHHEKDSIDSSQPSHRRVSQPESSAHPTTQLPPPYHQLPHHYLHHRYGPPPNVPMYPSEAAYFEYLHAQNLHQGGPGTTHPAYLMMSGAPPGITTPLPTTTGHESHLSSVGERRVVPSHILQQQRGLPFPSVVTYHSLSAGIPGSGAAVPQRPNISQLLRRSDHPVVRPGELPSDSMIAMPGIGGVGDASPNSTPAADQPLAEPESYGIGTPASANGTATGSGIVVSNSVNGIRVKVLIPGGKAGVIIGRQGQVINGLRHDFGCRITISEDASCPDRVLVVSGNFIQVADVLRRVCMLFSGGGNGGSRGQGLVPESGNNTEVVSAAGGVPPRVAEGGGKASVGGIKAGKSSGTKGGEKLRDLIVTLAVPSQMCGCLIGRSGIQIKNFRQEFGVSFSVSSHALLDTLDRPVDASALEETDRPVDVSGPPLKVADCLAEVCRLLASSPIPAGNGTRRGGGRGPPPIVMLAGGAVDRSHGEDADNGGRFGGAFFSNWRRNVGDAEIHLHGGSDGEAGEMGEKPPAEESTEFKQRAGAVLLGRDGMTIQKEADPVGSGEMLGSAIEECSFELNTGEIEVHLLVPNDIVGCIIGRKGKTISEIRETSGAFIAITESAFPPPVPVNAVVSSLPPATRRAQRETGGRGARSRDRVICIRGRSRNVRTARYLMGSSILNAQRGTNSIEGAGTSGASRAM